ncbi:MAG TPA: hypothetical protein VFT62_04905 [Mycobacteriales bacterium]|nr:hypothetical protein [Mycobacteriales bacterium]
MAERYRRLPLVARESRGSRAAVWRFRLGFALLLLAIIIGLVFLYRALTGGNGEGSPGVGTAPAPALSGAGFGHPDLHRGDRPALRS